MKRFLLLFILLIFLSTLSSCVDKFKASLCYNCLWTCDNPVIQFTVGSKEEVAGGEGSSGYLICNDEEISIICHWTHNNLKIYYKDKYKIEDGAIDYEKCVAISTSYEERKENKIFLKIIIDNVFDNKYKNITLTRHDL